MHLSVFKILTLNNFINIQESCCFRTVSRGRKEFIAIDEKEFLSVSDLVRGPVKLADVNKV